ncbi:MAG: benzoate transporter [Methylobacterium sp.]|nr:MAG: benzoate transporter [Methylobacterium sp.]
MQANDNRPLSLVQFRADFSVQAAVQGFVVAIVGYTSSVAIVIKGLAAVGATEGQITSALLFVGLSMGCAAMLLSLTSRMPVSVAWTTPGMALLGTTGAVAGGFPAVTGAFIITGALIVVAAFWSPLARFIEAIPKPIANAMLAGILFKLCLAPFMALQVQPVAALAVLGVWIVMLRLLRLWAAPAAVLTALALTAWNGGLGASLAFAWPRAEFVAPTLNLPALLGVALPLFVVTMASQNITGLAVLSTFGYRHRPRDGLMLTGFLSMLTAPFAAPTVNYSAITAAMTAGPEAHPDPLRRYVTAVSAGLCYALFGAFAAVAAAVVLKASPVLIEAAAGLALVAAFGSAMNGAIAEEEGRLPALLTFFVAASGLTLFGIGGAFWGLILGWSVHLLFTKPRKSA